MASLTKSSALCVHRPWVYDAQQHTNYSMFFDVRSSSDEP